MHAIYNTVDSRALGYRLRTCLDATLSTVNSCRVGRGCCDPLGHVACSTVCVCAVSNGILYTVYADHAPASHAMRVYTPFRTITSSLISSAGRVPLTLPLHL